MFFYPSFIFDRSENSDGIAYFCTHKKNVITRKPSHQNVWPPTGG
jgi:hypothetical protein